MATATLEERVRVLESEVTRLKERFSPTDAAPTDATDAPTLNDAEIIAQIERIRRDYPRAPRPKPTSPDFLNRFAGRRAG